MSKTREALLKKANELPFTPGVYIMKNAEGRVIYVGKSRKLKARVSQYFQNSPKAYKTERMCAQVADFDYFLCSTEMEALALENTLIKQYSPRYNIKLKDAKSYPYIKITAEPYPRLRFTRTRAADKAQYFGPYSGSSVVNGVLHTLQKTLKLPTCNRQCPRDIGKERPCLYHQLGQCCAPCTGKVSEADYAELIRLATEILRGNTAEMIRGERGRMEAAAEAELYEKAAAHRDRMFALEKLSQKQKVLAAPDTNEDIFGYYADDYGAAMAVFYVRNGALVDKREYVFGNDEILDEDSLVSFVFEHYRLREEIPTHVLLSFEVSEEELAPLAELLREAAGHRVQIAQPQRGERRARCELAVKNAGEHLAAIRRESEKSDDALVRLASMLALEVVPSRIESYDISNFGAEHKTCGMIVMVDGKFQKSDYRTFHIKDVEGTDDYASMREAISRRIAHFSDQTGAFSLRPDLILLDGGATHVATVRALLSERGEEIPVFGMVKDEFHKTRALCTEHEEISIAQDRGVFTLIYRIQEEVHRYAIRQMSDAKRKTLRTSSLESISGVGQKKAKLLLSHFGGLAAIKRATREELSNAPGIGPVLAEVIYQHFHAAKEEEV